MEFKSLDLHPDLARAIVDAGYVTATPVQEAVFAHSFAGDDIYAQSQTGTGKTAAFLIPILQRIITVPEVRTRKVLVLAPTRELAAQTEGEVKKLGKYLPISSASFFGGVGYGPQVDALRDNVQMMIGTPGRIIDLIQQGKMLLKDVGFLVIDEADRMFDMGFIDDLRRLIRYLPPAGERQTFLFSATLGLRVKDLAWEYMKTPHEVMIEPEHVTVDLVTQELHHVGAHEKMRLLVGILLREKPESAIIFANQKYMVEEISRRLRINGFENEYIMGDLPQAKRLDIIDRLKAGKLKLLIATDVAARGLDIAALDLVVNYDIPDDTESYVHRIGRTARAGKAGKAITLACEKFVFNLPSIEKFIGMKIPVAPWDPELMAEDESAGMRFGRSGRDVRHRQEDERGFRGGSGGRGHEGGHGHDGGRGREGGRARDGGRGHDGGRGRDSGRVRDGGRGPEADRPETRQGEGGGRQRQGEEAGVQRREQPPRQPRPETQSGAPSKASLADSGENLYALSQEERLARFKEKYGTVPPRPGERAQKAPASGGDSRQGGKSKPDPRREQRRPEGRGPAAPQSPRRSGQPEQHGQGAKGASTPAKGPRPAPQAAKKPGLLDRIKGIFGGKKKD